MAPKWWEKNYTDTYRHKQTNTHSHSDSHTHRMKFSTVASAKSCSRPFCIMGTTCWATCCWGCIGTCTKTIGICIGTLPTVNHIRRDGQSAGSNDFITGWEGRESANWIKLGPTWPFACLKQKKQHWLCRDHNTVQHRQPFAPSS